MKTLFKIISQTPAVQVKRQDGTLTQKSILVLQELGGKYESSFVAALLGNMASLKFQPNDLVFAAMRFQHREHNEQFYMDCTVQDIVKVPTSNAF